MRQGYKSPFSHNETQSGLYERYNSIKMVQKSGICIKMRCKTI
jgi:hypothetical protein